MCVSLSLSLCLCVYVSLSVSLSVCLRGLQVGQVLWHPSASNILASSSYDQQIIIWNTETEEALFYYSHGDSEVSATISCMSWDYNGSRIAFTSKDKTVNILDPRSGEILGVCGGRVNKCVCRCMCLPCDQP